MKIRKQQTLKKSILCSALLTAIGSTHSATITVDDNCSLIDAINSANNDDAGKTMCVAGSGADVIQIVQPNLTINITGPIAPIPGPVMGGGGDVNALPVIESEITIEGNGLILSGRNASEPIRMFTVAPFADLTLKDTTVSHANSQQSIGGSGLLAFGARVTLENTTFANNFGGVNIFGGTGNIIKDSVIRHNTLISDEQAAGLNLFYTNVQISNTSIIENEIIYSVPFRGEGGGSGPTFAGGVTSIQSEVDIINSTISGNRSPFGAGLAINDEESMPPKRLQDEYNLMGFGDSTDNIVSITNSTITSNQSYYASGILNFSEYGSLTIQGSIIAGNKESLFDIAPNIYNAFPSALTLSGHNIIGDNGSPGAVGVTLDGTNSSFINDTDHNLYPLTVSQGQLMHPLKVNSAAIDNNDLTCYGSITDQTGKARGIDGDGNGSFICDIGASEHSQPIVADGAPCSLTNAIISANNDASVGGCQPGNFHDIITLPENSTQTLTTVADYFVNNFLNSPFGLPSIDSAVTLEANNSVIARDPSSLENFDIISIENGGQLNLINSTVTGANGQLGTIAALYSGNVNVLYSTISNSESTGVIDALSINSSIVNSTIDQANLGLNAIARSASGVFSVFSDGFNIENSSITNNSNAYYGAITFNYNSLAKISNSTISNNTTNPLGGLAILAGNNTQLSGLTVTGNQGYYNATGGVYDGSNNSNTTISNSIISGNTVSAPAPTPNSAPRVVTLPFINPAFDVNTIQGGGSDPVELISASGSLEFLGTNIIGQNGDNGSSGVPLPPSVIIPTGSTDTVIDTTLADNGGATLTHLPVANGDAVDTGGSICNLRTDQLDRIRPWDGNNDGNDACDVGAVELGSVTSSDLIFKDGFEAEIILRRSLKE